jgi:hypothetical protein
MIVRDANDKRLRYWTSGAALRMNEALHEHRLERRRNDTVVGGDHKPTRLGSTGESSAQVRS